MAPPQGVLLVFHLPEGSPAATHRDFRRRVYGEEVSSWGGKYRYRRKGILDEIPHVRLYWGVIILAAEDAGRVKRTVRERGGVIVERMAILTTTDQRVLQRSTAKR